jgi:all-trans-retinol dehydrogenase (NAD+)
MKIIPGTKVLITGGASGIGKIMGLIVLKKGAELIIWDISPEKIEQTLSEFIAFGKVSAFQVDVSDARKVATTAETVRLKHGTVDLLINNAGIVIGKYFHEHTAEDIARSMEINAIAPMIVAREFLPGMMAQGSGHLCNITSSAGLISNPKMSVYVASKWAATGWSDSVRIEMQQLKTHVSVTTVTPYYINTGMFDGVRSAVLPILNPQKAARKIINGIERNRVYISMPLSVHFIRICQGLLPIAVFDLLAGKILGIYKAMDHFTGRKN